MVANQKICKSKDLFISEITLRPRCLSEISGLKATITLLMLQFFSADRHILESLLHVGRYWFEIFYIESCDCDIWSFWYMHVSRCVYFEA